MKNRFLLITILCLALNAWGQVHISIADLNTWTAQELAPYIGQTVVFDEPMVVCSNASSTLTIAPRRIHNPESQGLPGSQEYISAVHINGTCAMSLSGVSGYHRCGEKIYGLTAKVNSTSSLSFQRGRWEGNTRADMEAGLPDLGDYRLLVCGFNLENYFVANLGSQYLGADSYSEHQKQRAKVSAALKRINADIYGLVELEQGDAAIQEIVNDLNGNLPGRNYKFFHDATTGSSQKTDYVYDANKVEPIGTPGEISTELQYRKKMLCFREIATGEKFIYSINHFKSMNTGDESRRVNEARAVFNFYNTYRQNAAVRDDDLLLMGDLNCYAFTAPVQLLVNSGLIDLHQDFHADSSYSYQFSGMASYIDHALSSGSLYRQVTGMAGYHINSDESDAYTYDKSSDRTMFRCSDHDPVLVGLKLDSTEYKPYVTNDGFRSDDIYIYDTYDMEHPEAKSYFAIYNIDGLPICPVTEIQFTDEMLQQRNKHYTLSADNPYLPDELKQYMPLPSGLYIFHLYYQGEVIQHKLIIR